MSKIAVIGEIKGRVTGSGYRDLNHAMRTKADVWTNYVGTALAAAGQLVKNGEEVIIVSAVGGDFIGNALKADLAEQGMNIQFLKTVDGKATAMEIELLNIIGDLDFLVSGTEINTFIDIPHIESALDVINGCDLVLVDASLSEDVLRYIAENVTATKFFDPGNEEDALKAKDIIGKFEIIKPNRAEASVLYGNDIYSEEELKAAAGYFETQGVQKVFITLSGGGVYFKHGTVEGVLRPEESVPFVRKDGAGDAFSAAIADGFVKGMPMEEIAAYGMEEAKKVIAGKVSYDPTDLLWGDPQ